MSTRIRSYTCKCSLLWLRILYWLGVERVFIWFNKKRIKPISCLLPGIDIWRVINEPTAAALAYGLDKHSNIRNVVVVDLGGGTLDVSLMYVQGGMFSTQAMAGAWFNYVVVHDHTRIMFLDFLFVFYRCLHSVDKSEFCFWFEVLCLNI